MRIKFIAAAACLAAFFLGSPAIANDSGNTESNWNMQYIGFTAGVAQGKANLTAETIASGYFITTDPDQVDPKGTRELIGSDFSGSLFWGINRQSGQMVYGVEADLSQTDFNEKYSSSNTTYLSNTTANFSVSTEAKSDISASLRGRLGYADGSNLFYATIGVSLTRFSYIYNFSDTYVSTPDEVADVNETKIVSGWIAGFGIDQKLQDGWLSRVELLYSKYKDAINTETTFKGYPNDGFTHKADFESLSFRFGMSYKI